MKWTLSVCQAWIPLRFHQQEDFNKEEESEDRASQFNHLCHLTNKHRL